jgi:hypothetical protein
MGPMASAVAHSGSPCARKARIWPTAYCGLPPSTAISRTDLRCQAAPTHYTDITSAQMSSCPIAAGPVLRPQTQASAGLGGVGT